MRINFSESTTSSFSKVNQQPPNPGEIWELSRFVRSPLQFSSQDQQNLYSDSARRFLEGNSPPRYVMIVREPEPVVEQEAEWQIVWVMLFSLNTSFLNNVDLLIPSNISGIGQDLLAETWNVQTMLACNLSHSVGQRLSREVYDLLLTVGDYYHGLVDETPSRQKIHLLGLKVGAVSTKQQEEIQAFHRQEEAWSDVLKVPLAAYRTYLKTIKLTDAILDAALQLEQEFAAESLDQPDTELSHTTVTAVVSSGLSKTRVTLSQWFQNIFEAGWRTIEDFWGTQAASLAFTSRSAEHPDEIHSEHSEEIAALINQLSSEQDEHQCRRAAKRLGEIASGNSEAIQALINLLRTTTDDETLWTAVESLWLLDPGNPAAGVSRVKLIDLGMQLAGNAVALAVAMIQKADRQVGILLRVYPTDNQAYLPTALKLILLDESGLILRQVTARRADVYIQLKLSGQIGEQFSVRLVLGDASIIEDFVI